jgi:archaemetzincin
LIDLPEHNILVSPIGDLDSSLIDKIMKGVSDCFGYPAIKDSLIEDMEFAFDSVREQYNSTLLLEKLCPLTHANTIKVLAVCDRDLFIPILTHVYGEAQLNGKASVISIYRLKDNLPLINGQSVFFQRVIKEAVHELGHTFNIRHCPNKSCAMHYCHSIGDVDNKSNQLCRYCDIMLADAKKKVGPSL